MNSPRLSRVKSWYEAHERRISTGSLLFGFVFDSITLQRIDALRENLWIALNLLVVGTCIVLINRQEAEGEADPSGARKHFWLVNILQFGFGALLGAFFIFYFRSATLAAAWPFLLVLILAMVANELFQKRYDRLVFQFSFFYLSVFTFAIFLMPVLIHRIGPWVFLLSGVASLGVAWLFFRTLSKFAPQRFHESRRVLTNSVAAIFISMVVLYFTNIIPPIPLALKDGGIYHSIYRSAEGSYIVEEEEKGFFDLIRLRERVHVRPGDVVYAYSAVFSPTKLDTRIVHEWQYRDESRDEWVSRSLVSLPVYGGRAGGFRTYSTKSSLSPGKWRVNVATPRGQLIGRINFRVLEVESAPMLETKVKE